MAYRNTLQADALKLVAKKLQSSLAVEGEAAGGRACRLRRRRGRPDDGTGEEDRQRRGGRRDGDGGVGLRPSQGRRGQRRGIPRGRRLEGGGDRAGGHRGQRQRPPRRRHRADGRARPEQRPRKRERAMRRFPPTATDASTTRPTSRSSRSSPGRSSWPKSRSSPRAGAARPRPRHCPSSSGRWSRSGRRSRSARDARPQGHGGRTPTVRCPPPASQGGPNGVLNGAPTTKQRSEKATITKEMRKWQEYSSTTTASSPTQTPR